jgi:hypothetical protein
MSIEIQTAGLTAREIFAEAAMLPLREKGQSVSLLSTDVDGGNIAEFLELIEVTLAKFENSAECPFFLQATYHIQ